MKDNWGFKQLILLPYFKFCKSFYSKIKLYILKQLTVDFYVKSHDHNYFQFTPLSQPCHHRHQTPQVFICISWKVFDYSKHNFVKVYGKAT